MRAPFVVKLEISRMEEEIMCAIDPVTVANEVQAAVKKAVDEFDFEREVAVETHRLLRKCVAEIIQRRARNDEEFAREMARLIDTAIDSAFSLTTKAKGGKS
jgi:NCAIR mutase (PurE)-related protein